MADPGAKDTTDPALVTTRDGRRATLRPAVVADGAALAAIGARLAEAVDGMVQAPGQMRSADAERARIDDVYRARSAGDATLCAVAELDGEVVALADLRHLQPAYTRHVGVLAVGVDPRAQRLGLGRALMAYVIAHGRAYGLRRLELQVRGDNARAIALYRSLGFDVEGTRRRFVRLPDGTFVDDHVMGLWLE